MKVRLSDNVLFDIEDNIINKIPLIKNHLDIISKINPDYPVPINIDDFNFQIVISIIERGFDHIYKRYGIEKIIKMAEYFYYLRIYSICDEMCSFINEHIDNNNYEISFQYYLNGYDFEQLKKQLDTKKINMLSDVPNAIINKIFPKIEIHKYGDKINHYYLCNKKLVTYNSRDNKYILLFEKNINVFKESIFRIGGRTFYIYWIIDDQHNIYSISNGSVNKYDTEEKMIDIIISNKHVNTIYFVYIEGTIVRGDMKGVINNYSIENPSNKEKKIVINILSIDIDISNTIRGTPETRYENLKNVEDLEFTYPLPDSPDYSTKLHKIYF